MIILFDNKQFRYSYVEDREYDKIQHSFLKNTLKALDYISKHDLLLLTYKDESSGQKNKFDIIDILVDDTEEPVYISQDIKNQYNPSTNVISFNDTHGVSFRKDHKKNFTHKNLGFNSPIALLAHEIIHCFHELYDEHNYKKRKLNKSTKGLKVTHTGRDLSFPNKEEELVVRLTNQVIRKLGEDVRRNYGRNYFKVKDVLSTEKDEFA
jgi:hypothetical protein